MNCCKMRENHPILTAWVGIDGVPFIWNSNLTSLPLQDRHSSSKQNAAIYFNHVYIYTLHLDFYKLVADSSLDAESDTTLNFHRNTWQCNDTPRHPSLALFLLLLEFPRCCIQCLGKVLDVAIVQSSNGYSRRARHVHMLLLCSVR